MMDDPKTMSIYEKLLETRKSVPYLKKEAKGYNYKYVKGVQVLSALREKLDELGLLLIPEIISTTYQEIKTPKAEKVEFEAKPKAEKVEFEAKPKAEKAENLVKIDMLFTWLNVHKPDEKVECRWSSMGQNEREKGIGAAMTYAERYFLLKFFMIATDELDPDAYKEQYMQEENEPKQPPPKKTLTINDVIPNGILPPELHGKGITFLQLGKDSKSFSFASKLGPQDGLYLLNFWVRAKDHPAHTLAKQVLDVLSQAATQEDGPTTPQQ